MQQGEVAAEQTLRVFAGPNAGAEMRLSVGDWMVGTGAEADILLAEPALVAAHLRIGVTAGEVRATALAPGVLLQGRELPVGEPVPLPARAPIAIGASVLAFGPPGATWTLLPPPEVPPPAPEPPPSTEPASAPAEPAAEASKPAPAAATTAAPAPAPAVARRWRHVPLTLALAAMPAVGGAAALWWLLTPPPPRRESAATPAENQAWLVTQLRARGLQGRVDVIRRGDALTVNGVLRDEASLRGVQGLVRAIGAPVDLRLATEAQILEQGRVVLAALGLEGPLEQPRPGHLVVRGRAPDPAAAEEALRRLRTDLPLVRVVEDALVTPERGRTFLEQRLRDAGLATLLPLGGEGEAVVVNGTLGPAGQTRWQQVEAEFRGRFVPPLQLEVRIGSVAPPAPRGLRLGPQPVMVMPDGRQFGVGDAWSGARILAIEEDRLRVRGPGGDADLPYAEPPAWVVQERGSDGR